MLGGGGGCVLIRGLLDKQLSLNPRSGRSLAIAALKCSVRSGRPPLRGGARVIRDGHDHPSFALFGAYTFFERLSARQVVTAAEGTCPDCGKPQKLDTGGRWQVPRDVACRHCQRALRIS